jgi:hypothetical protein
MREMQTNAFYHNLAAKLGHAGFVTLAEIRKELSSTDSHESECGNMSHPAGCKCDTYDLGLAEIASENF